jgi:hypothetical protein
MIQKWRKKGYVRGTVNNGEMNMIWDKGKDKGFGMR